MTTLKIPIDKLKPNPFQPKSRIEVSEETAKAFGLSIIDHGIMQTPVCRQVDGHYEMGDGWLRRAGCVWAVTNGHPEYQEIDVDVRELTDEQMADMVLEANEVRKDLNPIDRAWVYQKYLDTFPSVTQAEFARRHNKTQGEVSNTIRLLDLPERVQGMIISQEIKESHGRTLLRIKDPLILTDMAWRCAQENWSVAVLDETVSKYLAAIQPKMEEAAAPSPEDPEDSPEPDKAESSSTSPEEPASEKPPEQPEAAQPTPGQAREEENKEPKETPKQATAAATKPAATATKPATAASSKTAASSTQSAPPKPKWGLKLILEEKDDHILISVMKAGGVPEFWKYKGTLDEAILAVPGWLAALEKKWEEGK